MYKSLNFNILQSSNTSIFKIEKKIFVVTPEMKLLFPVEEKYNNIILKMEFFNLDSNEKTKNLLNQIKDIELLCFNKIKNLLNNENLVLKSQIYQNKNYNPYLLVKILRKNNKYKEINTKIVSDKSITIFDIKPKDLFKMNIFIDNIFINYRSNQVIIKWKVSEIYF